MIDITIDDQNESRAALLEAAGGYFLQRLMPRKREIGIRIELIDRLRKKDGILGDCNWLDARESGYVVRVDSSQTIYGILSTISHEFVHIRQFCKGHLRFKYNLKNGVWETHWKGQVFAEDEIKYKEQPWEIECQQLEKVLVYDFLDRHADLFLKYLTSPPPLPRANFVQLLLPGIDPL